MTPILTMDKGKQAYQPAGWPTVVPRLSTSDPRSCVTFVQTVFAAEGDYQDSRPSELRIGDSIIMVGGSIERAPTNAFLYVYVPDVDKTYAAAIASGANSIEAPLLTPYGDRRAMIEDPWGNRWQIATHGQARRSDAEHA